MRMMMMMTNIIGICETLQLNSSCLYINLRISSMLIYGEFHVCVKLLNTLTNNNNADYILEDNFS